MPQGEDVWNQEGDEGDEEIEGKAEEEEERKAKNRTLQGGQNDIKDKTNSNDIQFFLFVLYQLNRND